MSARATLGRVWLGVLGIVAGTVYGCGSPNVALGAVVSGLGVALLSRRRSPCRLGGLVLVAFAFGSIGAALRCSIDSALTTMAHDTPRCEIAGRVLESAGGLGTLVSAVSARCDGYRGVRDAGVLVLDGDVGDAGSPIEARGWLLPLRDDTFDLARARLGANAYFDVATLHLSRPDAPLLAAAALIKSGLLRATSRLDKPQASLLQGLTIGDTEGFDDQTLESFRRAGLSHLLAVSGENVAIVLGAIAVGARALGLRLRLALAVIGLVLFVVVVGPEPSVLRAAIMGAIGLAALAFGRKAEPLHALGLALIVLIALRPGMVYSVALQLSAAATAGIVLWSASLAHRFGRVLPRTLSLGLSATLSAQSAVAPVLIATFGQVSVVGPLSNLLALPAVAPATIIGLVAGVAGIVNGSVGALLARCAAPFAAWILWVARVFGSARGAAVDLPNWTAWLAALPVTAGAIRTLRGHSAS